MESESKVWSQTAGRHSQTARGGVTQQGGVVRQQGVESDIREAKSDNGWSQTARCGVRQQLAASDIKGWSQTARGGVR